MTLIEIDDEKLISLLPATTSQLASKLSGTTDKKSRKYKSYMSLVNRHMESMKRYKIVRLSGTMDRSKFWTVIQ